MSASRTLLLAVVLVFGGAASAADDDARLARAAAGQALEAGDVEPALAWVPAAAQTELRAAFARALAVRAFGPDARAVADAWFADTVARLRSDEEPLASTVDPDMLRRALDRSLAARSSAPLRRLFEREAKGKLDRALADVRRLADYDAADLASGRLYLRAYVALFTYAGRLAAAAAAPVTDRPVGAPAPREQLCVCDCPDCAGKTCAPCTCLCDSFDDDGRAPSVTQIRR